MMNEFELIKLKPIPRDQHSKISIQETKPQFEIPLKESYHFRIGDNAK
jgi:hypothetical protein